MGPYGYTVRAYSFLVTVYDGFWFFKMKKNSKFVIPQLTTSSAHLEISPYHLHILSLFSFSMSILISLNPRITTHFIPESDSNNDDVICYHRPETLCSSLIDGHREMVATWHFLSPSYLLFESTAYTILFLSILFYYYDNTKSHIPSTKYDFTLPRPFQFITGTVYAAQVRFKLLGYANKVAFLLMPCNLLLLMAFLLSFSKIPNSIKRTIVSCWFSFQTLVWVVFLISDTRDLQLAGEVEFFWINHILLLFLPFYYILTKKITRNDISLTGSQTPVAISLFGITYFFFGSLGSVVSGLNINYMMAPPQIQPLLFCGKYFRSVTVVILSLLFYLGRAFSLLVSLVIPLPTAHELKQL